MNHATIIDAPLWYKIWQRSGHNLSHVKQQLLRRRKRAYRRSWNRRGSQKSFTLTIPMNLASPVKNYSGIIVRPHHTDQKRMGLLREQCVELTKGHLRYCCNQVWMKIGGQIPWNATAICETFKISCLTGRPHMRGGSENHFNGPIIPFGSLVEYYPISAKDQSRIHQFGKKVLPGLFLGYALYAG